MKNIKLLFLVTIGAFGLTACDFPNPFLVTEIQLDHTTLNLGKSETSQLTATVLPIYALNKTISWTSSDKDVATVNSNGLVTAKGAGETTIFASATDGSDVYASCAVTVSSFVSVLESLSFENVKTSYNVGDAFVKPTVIAHYSSGNTKVVTNSATFTGYNMNTEGVYTVTASYSEDGKTATGTFDIAVGSELPVSVTKQKLGSTYADVRKSQYYKNTTATTIGETNLLVIPVWFTDSTSFIRSANKSKVRDDIETAYLGTNAETGWRSVKTYYEEESHNRLTVKGTVSDWYECGKSSSYYNSSTKTTEIVKEATEWYFTNNSSVNRKDFDTNNDGYLDGVMIIYGSPDNQAYSSASSNAWAYCYWTQDYKPSYSKPTPNVYFWASYDFMYDSSTAGSRAGTSYSNGDCSHSTIDTHTFIHEMGHVFGLDDYYDYSYQYCPAGGFSMQDYNVGGHDPYSAMALGWVDPYIPTETMTITINPYQSSGDVILLTPSWNSSNSPFDEYLLLELFTPTGLNKLDCDYKYSGGYPSLGSNVGIRVWHVDARLCEYKVDNGYLILSEKFSTNPKASSTYGYDVAMSNTYVGDQGAGYITSLGEDYANYNLLQYIRNSTTSTYYETNTMNGNTLFKAGDTFTMSKYSKQFVNGTKLNSNINLEWSFRVDSCNSGGATITVTRG